MANCDARFSSCSWPPLSTIVITQSQRLIKDANLQSEVGEGQIVMSGWRMGCSYSVMFYHDGRRRVYQHMTGAVVKTNREWQEIQRRYLNLMTRDGWEAELHLADGKIAHGYLQIKDFGAGAPGRSVLPS